ncbi:MAG TPA: ferric reductase-like transmembrane domain-containing protein [Candidatus Thermoplasmatota archaeon]|nr:ferric reductase-like transmembrane domain-containing protein [Candidatus Thermoplasmatota archaeon]
MVASLISGARPLAAQETVLGRSRQVAAVWPRRPFVLRHAVVGSFSTLVVVAFVSSFADLPVANAWNRAFADTSLVLLGLTMLAGPLARVTGAAHLLSARRELGVWTGLLACSHVGLVAYAWAGLDPALVFPHADAGLTLANLIGVAALAYVAVLLVTSNDRAQRRLGVGWKFLQRGATTFYVLALAHTVFFAFLFEPAAGPRPSAMIREPLVAAVAGILTLQATAFWLTVRRHAPD